MSKDRLNYIDIAKALAIIAMVSQHIEMSIEQTVSTDTMNSYSSLQLYIILTWIMPIFFVITGYCSNYKKEIKPFVVSLIISIGFPIFFFDIIPVNVDNFNTMPLTDAIKHIPVTLSRFFRYSFWFLRALFVTKLLYWFLCRYTLGLYKTIVIILLYLIACIAVIKGYGDHGCHSLIALTLLASGAWMKKRNLLENNIFCIINLVVFGTIIIVMWLLMYQPPCLTESLKLNYLDIIYFPIVSLTGSVSIIYLSKLIGKCCVLEFVGKYSLVVYCFHYYVNGWLNFQVFLSKDSSLSYSLLYLITHVIITVTLCCIFAYIVDRPYMRVIIGKKP